MIKINSAQDIWPPSPVPSKSAPKTLQDFWKEWFEQTIIISPANKENNPSVLLHDRFKIAKDCNFNKISCTTLANDSNYGEKRSIKYQWKKGINLPLPDHKAQVTSTSQNSFFPNEKQINIINNLKTFPVFAIQNGFHEIVLGKSSHDCKKNWRSYMYDTYVDNFLSRKDVYPVSLGFFFFNPNDALEFENTVFSRYPYNAKELEVKTTPVSIHHAYILNRTSLPKIQFKFIPDLEEIVKLLKTYKYEKNIQFHAKQIHGKDFFQGQPIYMVKPKWLNKKSRESILQAYNQTFKVKSSESIIVYTSRDSAYKGWQKFLENNPTMKLPTSPPLIVYNFENFIIDCESESSKAPTDFTIITNHDSYMFCDRFNSSHNVNTSVEALYNKLKTNTLFIKIWMKRILWSLTTTHSPN